MTARTSIVAWLVIIASARLAHPAPAADKPAIMLTAKTTKQTGKDVINSWGDRENRRGQSIEVSVRNAKPAPASVSMHTFFVARDPVRKENFVYDQRKEDIDLGPRQNKTVTVTSKLLDPQHWSRSENSVWRDGVTPSGWIVQVWHDNEVLKVAASSRSLEQAGNDPDRMNAMIEPGDVD